MRNFTAPIRTPPMSRHLAVVDRFYVKPKDALLLLALWLLLYFEPLTIGSIKISQLWKAAATVLLFVYIIRSALPMWALLGIFFALKYLAYSELPYGFMIALADAMEALIFPLLALYFFRNFRCKEHGVERLQRVALLLSIFMLFSAIPFLLGLDSLNPITTLERYGLESRATKGIFYQIAVSSQTYCAATLTIIAGYPFFKKGPVRTTFFIFCVLLGSYLVYGSFTRTGWAVYGAGLILVLLYGGQIRGRRVVFGAIAGVLVVFTAAWIYQTNSAVQLRVKGGATYRQNVELSADQLLKARLPFIFVAFDNLKEEGLAKSMIGYGTQHGQDLFERKTGMAIVSHNRTMEILEASGVFGLLLYLLFVIVLFRKSRPRKTASSSLKSQYFVLAFVFAVLYLTSHGMPLWGNVIFSAIVAAGLVSRYQEDTQKLHRRVA